jgi:hypothetical protein
MHDKRSRGKPDSGAEMSKEFAGVKIGSSQVLP